MVLCMLGTLSRLHGLTLTPASNVCRATMCFGLGVGIGRVSRFWEQANGSRGATKPSSKCSVKSTAFQKTELKKFVDPLYMAQYYTDEGRKAAKGIGFSVDWRREFTTCYADLPEIHRVAVQEPPRKRLRHTGNAPCSLVPKRPEPHRRP